MARPNGMGPQGRTGETDLPVLFDLPRQRSLGVVLEMLTHTRQGMERPLPISYDELRKARTPGTDQLGHHITRAQARRAPARPVVGLSIRAGDTVVGRVAPSGQHDAVRKKRAALQATRSHPRSFKGSRAPTGEGVRRKLGRTLQSAVAASSSGRVILEAFAGSQRFTKAARKLGYGVVRVDTNLGSYCNVLDPVVLNTLGDWIVSGRVQGLVIATPCGSESRARRAPQWSRFPSAIRSNERPRCLCGLKGADLRAVTLGNKLADAAFSLIQTCYKHGVLGVEENPYSSFLWLHRWWPQTSNRGGRRQAMSV